MTVFTVVVDGRRINITTEFEEFICECKPWSSSPGWLRYLDGVRALAQEYGVDAMALENRISKRLDF